MGQDSPFLSVCAMIATVLLSLTLTAGYLAFLSDARKGAMKAWYIVRSLTAHSAGARIAGLSSARLAALAS
jgi:hypothetical protein